VSARALTLCLVALALGGCGGALRPAPPARLAATVIRSEEQGIDFVASHRITFALTLGPDGTGEATGTTRGVDVYEAEAREVDETGRYDARARWEGERLVVQLTPRGDPSPGFVGGSVELVCERWGAGARAEQSDAVDPALPGVEWVCALPGDRTFALGLVVMQHVPREGAFLLLGETRATLVREDVSQSTRRVETSASDPDGSATDSD